METTQELQELSFEAALARLEELVAKMESGKLPLENLIADYERGARLLAGCRAKLDAMERKIELLKADDDKAGQWTEFQSETPPRQSGELF